MQARPHSQAYTTHTHTHTHTHTAIILKIYFEIFSNILVHLNSLSVLSSLSLSLSLSHLTRCNICWRMQSRAPCEVATRSRFRMNKEASRLRTCDSNSPALQPQPAPPSPPPTAPADYGSIFTFGLFITLLASIKFQEPLHCNPNQSHIKILLYIDTT